MVGAPPSTAGRWAERRLSDGDRECLREAVRAVEGQLGELSEEVGQEILLRQTNLVDMSNAVAVSAVMRATLANVGTILSTLAFEVRPDGMDVPEGALELLDHVAQEQAALPVMLRAYRLGAAGFNRRWVDHLGGFASDMAQLGRLISHSLDHVAVYVDRVSEVIVGRWETVTAEVARSGRRRAAAARALLTGDDVDVSMLEHPVDIAQVALAVLAAPASGSGPLMRRSSEFVVSTLEVEVGDGSTVMWLATKEPAAVLSTVLAADDTGWRGWTVAAVAEPGLGGMSAAGRDVRGAVQVFRRVRPEGGAAHYRELALLSALLADTERAQRLVHSVLGPLADPDPRSMALCDTLRAYFRAGERKTGAAALLGIHEKTVAHRLGRIEEALGASVTDRRADLESALLVHQALIRPGVPGVPITPL